MRRRRSPVLTLLAAALSIAVTNAAALEVGERAPAFEAESTAGTIKLADYQGKKNVLLAAYYKDFTSG
jgi:peroxiredoxin Q/BCP